MRLLLDAHASLWMSLDDPQLSETAREKLSDAWLSPLFTSATGVQTTPAI